MKKIFSCLGLFLFFLSLAQVQKGITDSGKEVVLFDNGTWRFAHESDAKTLETIATNPANFEMTKESVHPVRSSKVNMAVFYNPKKWKVAPNRQHNMEYLFTGEDNLYASLTTEKTQIPNLKIVKEVIIENVKRTADYFRLKQAEYRNVNGKKMLYMRYIANLRGLDFEYAGYYYISATGFAMLVGFSQQKDFEQRLPELEKFLNGFAETELHDMVEEVVDIKLSPPPPPSKSRDTTR